MIAWTEPLCQSKITNRGNAVNIAAFPHQTRAKGYYANSFRIQIGRYSSIDNERQIYLDSSQRKASPYKI